MGEGGGPPRPPALRFTRPPVLRSLRFLLVFVGTIAIGGAEAGHELTFYPSFYPQEITLRAEIGRAHV